MFKVTSVYGNYLPYNTLLFAHFQPTTTARYWDAPWPRNQCWLCAIDLQRWSRSSFNHCAVCGDLRRKSWFIQTARHALASANTKDAECYKGNSDFVFLTVDILRFHNQYNNFSLQNYALWHSHKIKFQRQNGFKYNLSSNSYPCAGIFRWYSRSEWSYEESR